DHMHSTLLPALNTSPIKSKISMDRTPFHLQEGTRLWQAIPDPDSGMALPRRAMINSFGAGGAYANLVVEEEAVDPEAGEQAKSFVREHLFIFSAKTKGSLKRYLA